MPPGTVQFSTAPSASLIIYGVKNCSRIRTIKIVSLGFFWPVFVLLKKKLNQCHKTFQSYLFCRRSHSHLDYNDGSGNIFFLHALTVHFDSLDSHFGLLWNDQKHTSQCFLNSYWHYLGCTGQRPSSCRHRQIDFAPSLLPHFSDLVFVSYKYWILVCALFSWFMLHTLTLCVLTSPVYFALFLTLAYSMQSANRTVRSKSMSCYFWHLSLFIWQFHRCICTLYYSLHFQNITFVLIQSREVIRFISQQSSALPTSRLIPI